MDGKRKAPTLCGDAGAVGARLFHLAVGQLEHGGSKRPTNAGTWSHEGEALTSRGRTGRTIGG